MISHWITEPSLGYDRDHSMASPFNYISKAPDEDTAFVAQQLKKTFSRIGELTGKEFIDAPPIRVFLFQTIWQMRDFLDHDTPLDVSQMDQFSGITWFDGEHPAMATSVEDQSLHSVCSTLQHELFHCWEYITTGSSMVPWLSEGYAQRFEDVIVTEHQTITDRVNAGRIERLRYATEQKQFMPMPLLMMTVKDHVDGWSRFDQGQMGRFYDQAWAFVHFLNTIEPLGWSLDKFLQQSDQSNVIETLRNSLAGCPDISKIGDGFEAFYQNVEADPLSVAIDRLEMIAIWMLVISSESNLRGMKTVEKLRQLGSYHQVKKILPGRRSMPLSHQLLYQYQPSTADELMTFEVLEEEAEDLLPRLQASNMAQLNGGTVTLAWHRGRLGPTPDLRFESGN